MDNSTTRSPEELVRLGEQLYFENKDMLEKEHYGEFVVFDVESKEYFIDADKLKAIQAAQEKYPGKLFYIVQIGNLKQTSSSLNELKGYAWPF